METVLTGLTWDHPRGYAPLIGGASEYERLNPGLTIRWDRRTLREFRPTSVDHLAAIVALYRPGPMAHIPTYIAAKDGRRDISYLHPRLEPILNSTYGIIVYQEQAVEQARRCLQCQLNIMIDPSICILCSGCVDICPYDCISMEGLSRVVKGDPMHIGTETWTGGADMIIDEEKCIRCGLCIVRCPTDAISLFFTLSANLGHPIAEASDIFIEEAIGREVLDRLHALISAAHPNSIDWNPVQVYDFMVSTSDAIYCPYGFGYSNYSRPDMPLRLKFADAPAAGPRGCAGTMLGGTGVAISKKSTQQQKGIEYAKWLVSRQHQCGTYFRKGGQPANLTAWTDPAVDSAAGGFFSGTVQTLQTAYLRPRFDGFVRFFESAGIEINKCLRGQTNDAGLIVSLNAQYARQRQARQQNA